MSFYFVFKEDIFLANLFANFDIWSHRNITSYNNLTFDEQKKFNYVEFMFLIALIFSR